MSNDKNWPNMYMRRLQQLKSNNNVDNNTPTTTESTSETPVETENASKRFNPNVKFYSSPKEMPKKESVVTMTEYANGDIYLQGDMYNYKDELKRIIPLHARNWDSLNRAWVCKSEYRDVLIQFVSKINNETSKVKSVSERPPPNSIPISLPTEKISHSSVSDMNEEPLHFVTGKISQPHHDYQVITSIIAFPEKGKEFKLSHGSETRDFVITKVLSRMQFYAKDTNGKEEYFLFALGNWMHQSLDPDLQVQF